MTVAMDAVERIDEYQDKCAEKYDALDVDLNDIPVEMSGRMQRTAGKVRHKNGDVKFIRYATKAYKNWNWQKFKKTIRHELIHVHQVQNFGHGGHGEEFKRLANSVDTHVHCESFAKPKYLITCVDCGTISSRYTKSKVVKYPERYRCGSCGGDLVSDTNDLQ